MQNGTTKLDYIPSEENDANLFKKPFSEVKSKTFFNAVKGEQSSYIYTHTKLTTSECWETLKLIFVLNYI